MKGLIIITSCIIIGLVSYSVNTGIDNRRIQRCNNQKDSTINWYQIRYQQDSNLIRDIAVLTTDNTEIKLIFKFNHRNIKSYN